MNLHTTLSSIYAFGRRNWFLLGLLIALVSGFRLPGYGAYLNPDGKTTTFIIVILFLVTGFTLPSERIREGISNYRLHVFIQCFSFVFIPLYFFIFSPLFRGFIDGQLMYGLFALAVLPTTISTCVVFTQTTGGNTVAAMFNSSLANIAGVFVSPLLLSLFLSGTDAALPPEEIIATLRSLTYTMLLPTAAGQVFHYFYRDLAAKYRKKISEASSALILFIVFITISNTAADEGFMRSVAALGLPFGFLGVSHILFSLIAYQAARIFDFPKPDRVAAMFVSSQKTMAMGVPLLTIYFSGRPDILGIVLLPLLFYHPFQLLTAGVIRSLPQFRLTAPSA